jgi:tetratricopeptide (TPR) repeat protein
MDTVGRQHELQQIRDLLVDAGCVAVVGPPGIGKSAVAAALGAPVWADLETVRSEAGIVARLAAALGCPVDTPTAVDAAMERAELVVLDGAEEALDALAPCVARWSGVTRLLVTSRRRPVFAERVLELGPVSDVDGAQILRARVASARRAAELDERALSRALDGVPLALELAASRLRLYGPRELAERLAPAELSDARRRPRHQSLSDALRAAWDPLSADAREVLGLASRLAGPFDRQTLETLAARRVDDALLELLDAAMLHPLPGDPPRFRVLGPVRGVARELTPAAVGDAAVARLAGAWLAGMEEAVGALDGPAAAPALARLVGGAALLEVLVESPDPDVRLRAALALAAKERRVGPMGGVLERGPLDDAGERSLRRRFALACAAAAGMLARFDDARAAIARAAVCADGEHQAELVAARGSLAEAERRLDDAVALHRQALALRETPAQWTRLAVSLLWSGDLDGAADAFRRGTLTDDAFGRATAMYGWGVVRRERGEAPAQILADQRATHAEVRRAGFRWLLPRYAVLQAVLLADVGRHGEAASAYREAVAHLEAIGELDEALVQRTQLASVELLLGEAPDSLLAPIPGEARRSAVARGHLEGWRGVALGLAGHVDALPRGRAAVSLLVGARSTIAGEVAAMLAVAWGPAHRDAAVALLDQVDLSPMVERARQLVAGEPVAPVSRHEDRVLAALAAHHRRPVVVAADGRWFVRSTGERVDLSRRRVLRKVLAALALADEPLGVGEICAAAWPGERLVGDSGARRVHVAISTLRGLGLRSAIETVEGDGRATWRLRAAVEGA